MATQPDPKPDTINPDGPPEVPPIEHPPETLPGQPHETPLVPPDITDPGETPAEVPS